MATVHPSRMRMVPQSRPPPPPRRSPTPPPKLSREEELKMKLLAKRKQQPESGLKIKGVSKHATEDEPLSDIYNDHRKGSAEPGPSRDRSRRGSPAMRGWDDRDEDRGDYRRGCRSRSRSRQDDRYVSHRRSRSRSRSRPLHDDRYPPRQRSRSRDRRDDRNAPRQDDRYPPRQNDQHDARNISRSRERRPPPHRDDDRMHGSRQPPPHLPPFPPKWDQIPQVAPPIRLGFGGPGPAGLAPPPGYGPGGQGQGYGGPGQGYGTGSGPGPRGYGGNRFRQGGQVDFEKRRLERENNPLSIWPPSPKSPYRDEDDPKSKKKSKKSKSKSRRHRRYSDESDSTDSEEEERRRRRRKEKRRKEYSDDEGRKTRRSISNLDSEDEMDKRRRRRKSKSKSRSAISPAPEKNDDWKEKSSTVGPTITADVQSDSDDGEMVGPSLPAEHKDKAKRQAFKDMLPGEAAAMALYAAKGERIPRRGEVGLDSSRIEEFEISGYVMSGNRNKKMNAVRLRKENQVISAEEKRAILNLQKEERMKKEGAIISQFKELLDDNWRSQGLKGKPND